MSIGGKGQKEGISVYRYANRIPLLFEAHSDVVTQVCKNTIGWSTYHIKKNVDKVRVFVSIVSTKIPFEARKRIYQRCKQGILHRDLQMPYENVAIN